LAAEIDHWRQRLQGSPALELPTDRPHQPLPTSRGGSVAVTFPVAVAGALHALARKAGATLFMTLLAAFQALLHRYTAQARFNVGTATAGRGLIEIERLIGFFVNTVVLTADLAGDPSFLDLLARARDVTLDAYAHQDLPFEKLVEELVPERDLARPPLVQVLLALQNTPLGPLAVPGLALTPLPVASGATKFDLMLTLTESPAGLPGTLEYRTDLFDRPTMQRFVDALGRLLASLVAAPERPLSAVAAVAAPEQLHLLREWNDTAGPLPEGLVHERFARQAARTPDAAAVLCGRRRLSYGALDAAANRLARALRRRGVGADTPVALCLSRSPRLVVAVLAVLKAGGAYVPLDPTYPAERLTFMLADALHGVARPLLLTERPIEARLRLAATLPDAAAEVVFLDALDAPGALDALDALDAPDAPDDLNTRRLATAPSQPGIGPEGPAALAERAEGAARSVSAERRRSAESVAGLPPCATADNLAYVLYTSGSTGRPKGVMVHHRGLANYLAWCLAAYPMNAGAGAPLHSSVAFDLTVTSLFAPLLAGRAVVLLDEQEPIAALAAALEEDRYGVLKLTPSHLRMLTHLLPPAPALTAPSGPPPGAAACHASIAGSAAMLILGGEALFAGDLAAWRQHAPGLRVVNEYGPTETVVGCAVHEIDAMPPLGDGAVPIGRPITNLRLHLLGPHGEPVPLGARGEIHIGGHGVARGYLGR
ncbi:MAG TPA: AMP-binding protein, partial [Thermoanaerobaculia bacterium]|nr:AMP-binding protein [Thermoanaerobaculia bacterium]